MRTAEDLLQELTAVDESHGIEAKRCRQVDRSVCETVCAFSNEPGLGGGHLLLGVSRDEEAGDLFGRTYRVDGISDPDQVQKDLASQCASVFNRPVRPRVAVEVLLGKPVVVVQVLEAPAGDKPLFLTGLGLPRGAFRRVGSTDQEGTEDDLIALYAGRQHDTYDGTVPLDAERDDIDDDALSDYRRQRGEVNPDADELKWSDDDLLLALACARRDGARVRPNIAGLLLFGKVKALRRCLPMMRIDYIRVPGRRWVEHPEHRFDTLEIRAPLLTAIRRASNAVRDELMQTFSLPEGSLARQDEPTLPMRVIREAVVNAVMHRSYRVHGPVQIIRYANRLEIRNPGHSIKAEEQLGEPGSEARNPKLAAVLHDVNIAETKGSGIRVMRELMLAQGLTPPNFESSRRPDQFVATFLFHHFLGPSDLAWLGRLSGDTLTDEEARGLVFLREVGAIDNAAYRNLNRCDVLAASVRLRRLRDVGWLRMKGSGSRTYYVPGERFQQSLVSNESRMAATADVGEELQSHMGGPRSHMPAVQSRMPRDRSLMGFPALPPALAARLPRPGARPGRETLRSLLLALCGWQALSARELAALLGRKDFRPLVRDYLSPMVAGGQLAHTVPGMEKHPEQKYTIPAADGSNKAPSE